MDSSCKKMKTMDIELPEELIKSLKIGILKQLHTDGLLTVEQLDELVSMQK